MKQDKPKINKKKDKKPLERHKIVLKNMSENVGKSGKKNTMTNALMEQGYSESYAASGRIKMTKSWDKLLQEELTDGELMHVHKSLLRSARLDHMTFCLGPKDEEDRQRYIEMDMEICRKEGKEYIEHEFLTDEDITDMLNSVNCVVKKIVHRETARDVYFWSPDNMARDKALDKGYKLKGVYEAEKIDMKFKGLSKEQLIDSILSKIQKKK